ncbi:transcription factor Cys6 [Niveomyces insectorum RCEF 264]|uniref:Transcription factor Cys6 n=1 Tax=Niveomyces insectorum RCEF 264 TaxID=1081102 RepID=A0A162K525_9HYPO|nr:transcription factor Cys6 [Niveomyces insectorum RCEF 264]
MHSPLAEVPRARSSSASRASSGSDSHPENRKPRCGMPKVRTGCIVCRIRRIKCDEARPSCVRCTSTGRKCEGYPPPLPRKPRRRKGTAAEPAHHTASDRAAAAAAGCPVRRPSPVHLIPRLAPAIGGTERESWHCFWTATEHDVARHFGQHFWGTLALQAAREHPAVQYALDAVSALYGAYARREHAAAHKPQAVLDTPTSRAALVSYNTAVRLVADRLGAGNAIPLEAVLLCCLLFVWLEFLRNDFATGLRHLRSGLAILRDMPAPAKTLDPSIPHMFTRLQLQATLHGCPSSDFNTDPVGCLSEPTTHPPPRTFSTLAEARHALDGILVCVFQLVREKQAFEASKGGFQAAATDPAWLRLVARRDAYVTRLLQWHAAYERSGARITGNTDVDSPGILLLQLHLETAQMVLAGLFFESEMQYDANDAAFRRMLALAEKILACAQMRARSGAARPVVSALSLDAGVIPALCYVVLKCREPTVRRQALAALKRAPDREGMWHRDSLVAVTSWKVAVEERLAGYTTGAATTQHGPLPLSARIYRERVLDATAEGTCAVVHFDGGPTGSSVGALDLTGVLSRLGDMI